MNNKIVNLFLVLSVLIISSYSFADFAESRVKVPANTNLDRGYVFGGFDYKVDLNDPDIKRKGNIRLRYKLYYSDGVTPAIDVPGYLKINGDYFPVPGSRADSIKFESVNRRGKYKAVIPAKLLPPSINFYSVELENGQSFSQAIR